MNATESADYGSGTVSLAEHDFGRGYSRVETHWSCGVGGLDYLLKGKADSLQTAVYAWTDMRTPGWRVLLAECEGRTAAVFSCGSHSLETRLGDGSSLSSLKDIRKDSELEGEHVDAGENFSVPGGVLFYFVFFVVYLRGSVGIFRLSHYLYMFVASAYTWPQHKLAPLSASPTTAQSIVDIKQHSLLRTGASRGRVLSSEFKTRSCPFQLHVSKKED